jgi:GGDEF domain-containing protein
MDYLSLYGVQHDDPMAGVFGRMLLAAGKKDSVLGLFEKWNKVDLGSAKGDMRYPWQLSHMRIDAPSFCSDPQKWQPWRRAEKSLNLRPYEFEERFLTPIAICESAEILLESDAPVARELYIKLESTFRRDLVKYALSESPWHDMFALRCLIECPLFLSKMKPFALAIAGSYASLAEKAGGKVYGQRFPFHEKFLVSATSYLARALYATGTSIDLVSSLYKSVASAMNEKKIWGDTDEDADIMSTLAAAELLMQVDPNFDLDPIVRFFKASKNHRSGWAAFGPEEPWLTRSISSLITAATSRFSERFIWPSLDVSDRDVKTGIANFGWFTNVATLLQAIPDLAKASVQVAFIDLAGFKKFNDKFGQDAGDEVISLFAQHINSAKTIAAIRDGGDEFLLVGAPTSTELPTFIEATRSSWPAVFKSKFSDSVFVAPRIVWSEFNASDLRAAREKLGKAVGALKENSKNPGTEGAVMHIN